MCTSSVCMCTFQQQQRRRRQPYITPINLIMLVMTVKNTFTQPGHAATVCRLAGKQRGFHDNTATATGNTINFVERGKASHTRPYWIQRARAISSATHHIQLHHHHQRRIDLSSARRYNLSLHVESNRLVAAIINTEKECEFFRREKKQNSEKYLSFVKWKCEAG